MFLSLHSSKPSLTAILLGLTVASCGGRSGIPEGDGTGPLVACSTDSDCFDGNLCTSRTCKEGYCRTIATRSCDDGNICTSDACDPATGQCIFQSRVSDNDGDGYIGALPGTVPGALDSCGNDCDDSDPNTHPGATEICDGKDNNCDGRIDEGVVAYNPLTSPIRIADSTFDLGDASGIAYGANRFGITWTGRKPGQAFQGYASGYDIFGGQQFPSTNISQTSNYSFAGPLVWTGSNFATAWEVRAEKGYDIVFNRLDVNGKKLGPDVRISNNYGFSIQPALLWNGAEYWIAWSDDNGGDLFQIFGLKIDKNGQMSKASELTSLKTDARSPVIVSSPTTTLLVYLSATTQRIMGQLLTKEVTPSGSAFYISDADANDFRVAWVSDRFVIVWGTERETVGSAIWVATVDPTGTIRAPAQPITYGANFARSPNVESLGDRFALAWADDRLTYKHFGIRMRMFDATLNPLSDISTLIESGFDCVDPGLVTGGSGMALVYRERTGGNTGYSYFLPLACAGTITN